MIYLTLEELLYVAERTLGEVLVRDHGLLESALARPQTTVFGDDAYPSIEGKAAALLHSIARSHALVDGNNRLALAGTIAFLGMNGWRLTLSNDEAYDLVMAVAAGELDEVTKIGSMLGLARTRVRTVTLLAVCGLVRRDEPEIARSDPHLWPCAERRSRAAAPVLAEWVSPRPS